MTISVDIKMVIPGFREKENKGAKSESLAIGYSLKTKHNNKTKATRSCIGKSDISFSIVVNQ